MNNLNSPGTHYEEEEGIVQNFISRGISSFQVRKDFAPNKEKKEKKPLLSFRNMEECDSLDFSSKGLEILDIPNTFSNVTLLDISNNNLMTFPPTILSLQKLKILKADDNFFQRLPTNFAQHFKLERFSVSGNLLVDLPNSLDNWRDSLTFLDISKNSLKKFPIGILQCKSLCSFHFNKNDIQVIPNIFDVLGSLKELSMEWFQFLNPSLDPRVGKEMIIALKGNFKGMEMIEFEEFFTKMQNCLFEIPENFSFSTYKFPREMNILHLACKKGMNTLILKMASKYLNLIDEYDNSYESPLSICIKSKNYEGAEILLNYGACPNIKTNDLPLLLYPIINFEVDFTEKLLMYGADPYCFDSLGNTAWHILARNFSKAKETSQKIADILLEYEGYPVQKNIEGWAPIHISIRCRDINALKYLLANNLVDIDSRGKDEWTSLHLSAYVGDYETYLLLLKQGANPLMKCSKYKYCSFYARQYQLFTSLFYQFRKFHIEKRLGINTKEKKYSHRRNPVLMTKASIINKSASINYFYETTANLDTEDCEKISHINVGCYGPNDLKKIDSIHCTYFNQSGKRKGIHKQMKEIQSLIDFFNISQERYYRILTDENTDLHSKLEILASLVESQIKVKFEIEKVPHDLRKNLNFIESDIILRFLVRVYNNLCEKSHKINYLKLQILKAFSKFKYTFIGNLLNENVFAVRNCAIHYFEEFELRLNSKLKEIDNQKKKKEIMNSCEKLRRSKSFQETKRIKYQMTPSLCKPSYNFH